VAAQTLVLEHRHAREQHTPRLAFVSRECQRALQHVAGRQHPELIAQLAGAAAAVEHRDDGVDVEPGVVLEAAEQAWKAGAAAETADRHRTQPHERPTSPPPSR
jgi:hypothetical protein